MPSALIAARPLSANATNDVPVQATASSGSERPVWCCVHAAPSSLTVAIPSKPTATKRPLPHVISSNQTSASRSRIDQSPPGTPEATWFAPTARNWEPSNASHSTSISNPDSSASQPNASALETMAPPLPAATKRPFPHSTAYKSVGGRSVDTRIHVLPSALRSTVPKVPTVMKISPLPATSSKSFDDGEENGVQYGRCVFAPMPSRLESINGSERNARQRQLIGFIFAAMIHGFWGRSRSSRFQSVSHGLCYRFKFPN